MNPIKKLLIIVVSAIILSSGVNFFVQKGLKKYSQYNNERLSELLVNTTPYDLIFIGSSRTHLDINPKIIDSICKTNSYNFGLEGANLLEFYYAFTAYFEHHPNPKNVVVTIDLYSFNLKRKFFNHTFYYNYLPNKVIKEMLDDNGYPTLPYKVFPFLLLTQQDDYMKGNAIKGYFGWNDRSPGEFQYRGFSTNSTNTLYTNKQAVEPIHAEEIDTVAIGYLEKMVSFCKQKDIQLIFTYAPEYDFQLQKACINAPTILGIISTIAQQNNIPLFRDDSLAMCKNPNLFANIGHINRAGSEIYTAILANKLKGVLK